MKSKNPRPKTCPLCRNRYCAALAVEAMKLAAEHPMMTRPEKPSRNPSMAMELAFAAPQPDRIAQARKQAEELLSRVTT
jgi:hypothetical protein